MKNVTCLLRQKWVSIDCHRVIKTVLRLITMMIGFKPIIVCVIHNLSSDVPFSHATLYTEPKIKLFRDQDHLVNQLLL